MKTALIITGHMRNWKQLFPYFKYKYMDVYNPDIYIHTWNTEGWWKWGDFYRQSPPIDVIDVIQHYNPKKMFSEVYDSSFDEQFLTIASKYPNSIGYPKNMISQMYKWKKGIELLDEQYDLVIRTRTDVEYTEALPDFNPNYFYTPHHPLQQGGLGDMLHAGSQKDMTNFCNVYDHLDELYNQTNMFCSHMLTEQHLKNLNLNWIEFKCDYRLWNTPWGQHQDVERLLSA